MAIFKTQSEMRDAVRRRVDIKGNVGLARHPDADINDYVNRGIAALYRLLCRVNGDQRYLATAPIPTLAGVARYSLPDDFQHAISLEGTINGRTYRFDSYDWSQRPWLENRTTGEPYLFRLLGDELELMPVPSGPYQLELWYVPSAPQLTEDNDPFDTIVRLDDYVVDYAARLVAERDENYELMGAVAQHLAELKADIEVFCSSNRNQANPPQPIRTRITDARLMVRRRRTIW